MQVKTAGEGKKEKGREKKKAVIAKTDLYPKQIKKSYKLNQKVHFPQPGRKIILPAMKITFFSPTEWAAMAFFLKNGDSSSKCEHEEIVW